MVQRTFRGRAWSAVSVLAIALAGAHGATHLGGEPATRIGGRVWADVDGDAVQGAPDFGIPDVAVQLLDLADTILATTVTDEQGVYRFDGLTTGASYVVRVIRPRVEMRFVLKDVGGDDEADSDVDPTTQRTDRIVLSDPADAFRWDAGFRTETAAGRVWHDLDGNGLQGAGEPGVPGIALELRSNLGSAFDTTDADGQYAFPPRLADRPYELRAVHPGRVRTVQDAGADDAVDSDFPAVGALPLVLGAPQDDGRRDLGLVDGGTAIGNRVWLDLDANGGQDPGEGGLPDARVELLDAPSGAVLRETTTGPSGYYLFAGLEPGGTYILRFTRLPGLRLSPKDIGSDDERDSDVDPDFEVTDPFVLDTAADGTSWDAGMYPGPPIGLGGSVWGDVDGNGVRSAGDQPLRDVTVRLFDADRRLVATTRTSTTGAYRFDGLPEAGFFSLQFVPGRPEMKFIEPDVGEDDRIDSDADPATGETELFRLLAPIDEIRWGAGFEAYAVRGTVWNDFDADGIRDPEEQPSVAQLTLNTQLEILETQPVDGEYGFPPRVPDRPFRLNAVHPGAVRTFPDRDLADLLDSDFPVAGSIELVAGPADTDRRDLGLVLGGHAIGDYAWIDFDEDGLQDPDELGLPGVLAEALDEKGTVASSAISDEDGRYLIGRLENERFYAVRFTPPEGFTFTLPNQGSDTLDSDADPQTGSVPEFFVNDVSDVTTTDVGFLPPVRMIGGRVWEDRDADGLQDPGEPGVPDVSVTLFRQSAGIVGTTRTAADGTYLFTAVRAGERYVLDFTEPPHSEFTLPDVGDDDGLDSDVDPATGRVSLTLVAEEDARRWDAGVVLGAATLGDRVWKDADGNGVQDPREPGVPGLSVALFTSYGNFIDARVTNDFGEYRFPVVLPNVSYYLQLAAPQGMKFTEANVGDDDTIDSDARPDGRIVFAYASDPLDATRWDAGLVHDCDFPREPSRIVSVEREPDGGVTLAWIDPNPAATVTGFQVRRTEFPSLQVTAWDLVASDTDGAAWTDPEAGPPPGTARYYLVAPYNAACDAEGPF